MKKDEQENGWSKVFEMIFSASISLEKEKYQRSTSRKNTLFSSMLALKTHSQIHIEKSTNESASYPE